ncbi:MAG: LamG domain-containing protein, partial [Anaerolineales bacterium]|nr:LamG domain-containing protein [Anaerolineales bacterium]
TETVMIDLLNSFGDIAGSPTQRATVSGTGWSINYQMSGTRPQGIYTITLTAADQAGNSSVTTIGTIKLDERAPQVDTGAGNLWPNIAISQTVTLSGTAHDVADWGGNVVEHHFEEAAGTTVFYNTTSSQFVTPTNSTCTNCPTAGVPALFGSGVQFDGVDDIITIPTPLNPISNTFSAALWVRVDTLGSIQRLLQQLDDNGTGRTWLAVLSDGRIQSFLGGTATQSVSSVTAGNWHHVALTHDGTMLRIYLDGQLEVSASPTLETTEGGFYLGADKGGGNLYAGLMDGFGLYDRALTAEEVYGLAQSYAVGVTAVEIALEPATNFSPTTAINNALSSWQTVTLDSSGGATTGWQYSLPSGLEGFYEIYQRSTDAYGNVGRSEMVWRGLIDQVPPRITAVSGQQVWVNGQPRTAYSFTFTDFVLDETSYNQPCAVGELTHLTYNDDTLLQDGLI